MKAKCISADSYCGSLKKGRIYSVRMKPHGTMCDVFNEIDGKHLGSWFKDRFEIIPDVNPLTLIDKPFGQLDRHTQIELFCAWLDGKQIQEMGSNFLWHNRNSPFWSKLDCIRLAPEPVPLTKDSIDWSHVDKKYKYLRRDARGVAHVFVERPTIRIFVTRTGDYARWDDRCSTKCDVMALASYKQGTESWENAGIDRPD